MLRILRVVCTRLLELTLLVALTQRTPVLIPREVLIPPILEPTLLADPTLLDTAVLTAAATVDTAVEDTAAVTAVTVVVVTAVEATVVTAVEVIVAGAIAVEVIVAEAIAVEDSAATLINKLTAFLLQTSKSSSQTSKFGKKILPFSHTTESRLPAGRKMFFRSIRASPSITGSTQGTIAALLPY